MFVCISASNSKLQMNWNLKGGKIIKYQPAWFAYLCVLSSPATEFIVIQKLGSLNGSQQLETGKFIDSLFLMTLETFKWITCTLSTLISCELQLSKIFLILLDL